MVKRKRFKGDDGDFLTRYRERFAQPLSLYSLKERAEVNLSC